MCYIKKDERQEPLTSTILSSVERHLGVGSDTTGHATPFRFDYSLLKKPIDSMFDL